MQSTPRFRVAFAAAILLLLFSALATYTTVLYSAGAGERVAHTQEVRGAVGDLEAAIGRAARARMVYMISPADSTMEQYHRGVADLLERLRRLQELTVDNQTQVENCKQLTSDLNARIAYWNETLASRQSGEDVSLSSLISQNIKLGDQTSLIGDRIRAEETRLLLQRTAAAQLRFRIAVGTVMLSFSLALGLLYLHYYWLRLELNSRRAAEAKLTQSERNLRELSARLLISQDQERRRLGRELHDGLGQYLAALTIKIATLQSSPQVTAANLADLHHLAEETIREMRTVSHLLYPPVLEELGLKAAIPWYLSEFSKRSGIHTNCEVDPDFIRFDPDCEAALFRVLQEALTNVHRHSRSSVASVRLTVSDGSVCLEIEDQGKGISPNARRASEGIGLRSMEERVLQLGGNLQILSSERGTTIQARFPRPFPTQNHGVDVTAGIV